MVYKIFNTFIDDVFAWVVKMPMKHRIMTLRDDVVFAIFLYQYIAYRTDKSRANEFGRAYGDDVANVDAADGHVDDDDDADVRGDDGDGGGVRDDDDGGGESHAHRDADEGCGDDDADGGLGSDVDGFDDDGADEAVY